MIMIDTPRNLANDLLGVIPSKTFYLTHVLTLYLAYILTFFLAKLSGREEDERTTLMKVSRFHQSCPLLLASIWQIF